MARKGRGGGMPGGHPGMQAAGHPGGRGQEIMRELGMLGVHFYPPPMVLRRTKDIGLTPDQVSKLRDEMLAMRKKSIDLHAKLQHTRVEMVRLLAADKVDERAVAAQLDEGAKAEAEMHKLHVASMVRVRALLTPEQRQKLDEPKPARKPGSGGGGGGGRVGMADDADDADDDGDDDDDDDTVEG
jgi:periplasmic protein CpxP/Spy